MGSKEKGATTASKVIREEVGVCETVQDSIMNCRGKGSKNKEEEMDQGRNGTGKEGQAVGISGEFPPGAELEDIPHRCDLLMCLGLLKDPSPLQPKTRTGWILSKSLFLDRSHFIFRLIPCDLKVPCYLSLSFLCLQFRPFTFQG